MVQGIDWKSELSQEPCATKNGTLLSLDRSRVVQDAGVGRWLRLVEWANGRRRGGGRAGNGWRLPFKDR